MFKMSDQIEKKKQPHIVWCEFEFVGLTLLKSPFGVSNQIRHDSLTFFF